MRQITKMVRVVLTGGPSGGKTTIASGLQKDLGSDVVVVPEAASMLFAGGFPRRDSPELKRYQQRAIYFLQRELEGLFTAERSGKLLLCDRGSLDGVAYWPIGTRSFFDELNTTETSELQRYDWVIHLDTADKFHYDLNNPLRPEPHSQAMLINERILEVWKDHPQRIVIPNRVNFIDKMEISLWAVKQIMNQKSYAAIIRELASMTSAGQEKSK